MLNFVIEICIEYNRLRLKLRKEKFRTYVNIQCQLHNFQFMMKNQRSEDTDTKYFESHVQRFRSTLYKVWYSSWRQWRPEVTVHLIDYCWARLE